MDMMGVNRDLVSNIIAWEAGEMNEEETIEFFQGMIDSGLVWSLQGHYGRTAVQLIEAGHCHRREVEHGQKEED